MKRNRLECDFVIGKTSVTSLCDVFFTGLDRVGWLEKNIQTLNGIKWSVMTDSEGMIYESTGKMENIF